MSAMTVSQPRHAQQMDGTILTGVAGAVALILTTFLTGWWKWLSNKKKDSIDGQTALLNGFIALLNEFRSERGILITRLDAVDAENERLGRRVAKLENELVRHGILIPDGDLEPR